MFGTVKGFKKVDLQIVLKEIGENVPVENTIISLKELIEESEVYNNCPKFVEQILLTTIADRQLEEQRISDQEKERKLHLERIAKQENERITFEFEKVKMDHELKLAQIRMQEQSQNCFNKPKSKSTKFNETSAKSSDSSDENDLCRKRKRPASTESSEESLDESESFSPSKQSSLPRLLPGSTTEVPKDFFSDLQVFAIKDVTTENIENTQSALLHGMFKYMEKLNSSMDELNEKLDHLLCQSFVQSEEKAAERLPDWLELPLITEADLIAFNETLKIDKNLSAAMVRYLHSIGSGRTLSAYLLSITRKLLDQKLAIQYSRYGRKGKKSFTTFTETMNVVLSAAAMKYTNVDREILALHFGKALAGASDWSGRKARSSDLSNDNE